MLRLFTVRWPLLARLDALLFFPVGLILAAEVAPVRNLVDHTIAPALPPIVFPPGASKEACFWIEMAITCFVPYVVLLILTDRFLTVRKGWVLLSAIAVSIWVAAGMELPPYLVTLVAVHDARKFDFVSFSREVTLIAGVTGLLLHLRPFWLGLRDHGDVALSLIDRRVQAHEIVDVYQRRMADFQGWKAQDRLEAVGARGEGSGMRLLYATVWVGVILGIGFAYYHWSKLGGSFAGYQVSVPSIQVGPPPPATGGTTMHPSPMPAVPGSSTRSDVPAPADRIIAAALPTVQRPSSPVDGLDSGDAYSGPNEAVAARGRDGGYAFDAIVNGAHVPMLFDTGASVVALRAEDAGRFGISLGNLNYSGKVKTANGTADVAPVIIDTLTIGNITERRVVGYVAKEGMLPRNLLGQTFLGRLSGYNVENNQLVLKGRAGGN
jgi:clan AA aspartic protease (TIGR02281 family)